MGKKKKAIEGMLQRLQETHLKNSRSFKIAVLLHARCGRRVEVKKLYDMVEHVEHCKHNDCVRIYVEEEMCFIGNDKKELSDCGKAAEYLTFY